ncbi:hypothetical protein [Actinoplanes sp. L3-i22]|uniref:hypothetical protein n=1 Tax=Actinoplanes sp. L3-i22 TaxID=2836373 RepID=UPI001C74F0B6|nr:hypothetical protein [Actinoplanes sp. L3-i22]BCY11041.1 hypothetical protein L3i22_061290 [Actinoplanes sp. L3-i22]
MTDEIFAEAQRWRELPDDRNGTSELELSCRVKKIGEVVEARLGLLGSNPRKGTTHTVDNAVGKLADVVFTSLTAIASMGMDPRQAVAACAAKAAAYRAELAHQTPAGNQAGAA